jgi:cytochrome c oxidase cbb3-type subunit 1
MAVFGAFSFFAMGGIYFALPKILKRPLYSDKLAEWHFWLSFVGFLGFAISLWIGGFVQGLQWMDYTISFLDTVKAMFPYYVVRMFSAILMFGAQLLFAFNLLKTARGDAAPSATTSQKG